jgi:hypothetical protein
MSGNRRYRSLRVFLTTGLAMSTLPSFALKDLFNALPDSATGGDQSLDHYVNRAADPELDTVANLLQFIDWAPTSSETYLFTGLRGAGKTTELNRLVRELREQGIAAYYCDASIYLNLNDPLLSLPELLMAALAGLADAVRRDLGRDFLSDSIWQRTKRLLNSDVEIKPTAKLSMGGEGVEAEIEIEATLRENPDFRKELNKFAQASSTFYDEAQKFAEQVTELIRTKTNSRKVVLVVDSLERLSAPTGEESSLFDSLKQVFFNDPQRLRLPGFSVVYSAPPYLPAVLPGVNSGFSQCVSLPNFKVMLRPEPGQEPQRNPDGIQLMVNILTQRFANWPQVLAPEVLRELAWLSGGNVRRYFSLVRGVARKAALSKTALPIADLQAAPVQHAISEAAQPLQWLTAEDRRWLSRFAQDSQGAARHIEDLNKDLPSIIRLFDHSLVLDYRNGEAWFQVPPLVRQHAL